MRNASPGYHLPPNHYPLDEGAVDTELGNLGAAMDEVMAELGDMESIVIDVRTNFGVDGVDYESIGITLDVEVPFTAETVTDPEQDNVLDVVLDLAQ